jgi:hypothetical protein
VILELGRSELEAVVDVVREVFGGARSRRPAALTKAILEWHRRVYRRNQPEYYGQALDRVVHCADFAIWAALTDVKPRSRDTGGQPKN